MTNTRWVRYLLAPTSELGKFEGRRRKAPFSSSGAAAYNATRSHVSVPRGLSASLQGGRGCRRYAVPRLRRESVAASVVVVHLIPPLSVVVCCRDARCAHLSFARLRVPKATCKLRAALDCCRLFLQRGAACAPTRPPLALRIRCDRMPSCVCAEPHKLSNAKRAAASSPKCALR